VLPLKTGETVIGALDLHFEEIRSFPSEFVTVLSILADQLSIAIQNAALYERTQRTLREVEVNSRQMSASQWSGWVESIRARGYRYDGIRAEPLKDVSSPSPAGTKVQNVPIRLRGRTIGHLKIKLSEAVQGWTEDELAIAEATADRAALALEGARLLDEAQKRAAREAFLSEMAAKLSTSFQMDSILRDTVEELGQTLDGSTVSFQLINPSAPPKMVPTQRDDNPGRQIE
jgi:GAF domain-containing protein